jgi:glycosyltransferase involved in cell wall biosynthesis
MTHPTIAMLIPAYNAATYLPRLLESAVQQSHHFDEIWVYDDCSQDNTSEVAEQYGAHVVRGDVNRGCTYGKSVLLERTDCEWVHFHDSDDLLCPNFVARARAWMSKREVGVVVFGCEERWEDTRELISISCPDDQLLLADPIGYTIQSNINAISGIYRRSEFLAAGGFDLDPNVLYNEDQACHCRLARAGLRFRGDPTITVVNLRRRLSMWTSNRLKCHQARYHVMYKALGGHRGNEYREAIAKELWEIAAGAGSHLDWDTADKAAALAMRIHGPSSAHSGPIFKTLCRLSPRLAVRTREAAIRTFKPRLRVGYPGWMARVGFF